MPSCLAEGLFRFTQANLTKGSMFIEVPRSFTQYHLTEKFTPYRKKGTCPCRVICISKGYCKMDFYVSIAKVITLMK